MPIISIKLISNFKGIKNGTIRSHCMSIGAVAAWANCQTISYPFNST